MPKQFIGDFPVGTHLRAKFVGSDGWDDERQKWIDKNTGKTLKGTVVWEDESMYFRPDGVKNIILHDDELTNIQLLLV